MIRSLMAVVVALIFAAVGIVKPAYADSGSLGAASFSNQAITEVLASEFFDGVVNGAENAAGYAIGGILMCYAIDGVVTLFFPAAAAAAPLCSTLGIPKGAKAVSRMVLR